ncbi:hypothetical protein [Reinekea marinisedimentorum]|uniref:Uncharacterized protein n=1 Tax=Reinekea marinisedimentorum TaxID=230495 RepID=A0A4R3IE88_9GAMM|nr:hypothetical protein [Reinekea marinisedimentorum]TCS43908.1 hypothetical protein BCF53_101251 [Reinekea marinisedimentorum]
MAGSTTQHLKPQRHKPEQLTTRSRILASLLLLLLVAVNWWPYLDVLAQQYLTDTISSNAIVFGVVRTLNGVISVVQSSDVGIGVASITIGEIFDPVNDLVERFSGLLLVSLTALGIQQVILLFTTSLAVKGLFSAFAALLLIFLWRPHTRLRGWLKAAFIIVLLRYLLNLEVALVWCFDWFYFNATGAEALSVLEGATEVLRTLKDSLTEIDLGKLIFGNNSPDLAGESIGQELSASVVTLIVGMIFKSLLIPIGTLWLALTVVKSHAFHYDSRP